MITSADGGTGAVRVAVRSGARRDAESSAPVPVPSSPSDQQAFADRLRQPHREMTAWPGAVPCARHHARQLLWDIGLKELTEPVESVVSEIVTNAVRASGGLDTQRRGTCLPLSVVRLWLVPEQDAVLVLVRDGCPLLPERQAPGLDDDNGRGLLLVEALSAAGGSFGLAHQSGKVVWALCRG